MSQHRVQAISFLVMKWHLVHHGKRVLVKKIAAASAEADKLEAPVGLPRQAAVFLSLS